MHHPSDRIRRLIASAAIAVMLVAPAGLAKAEPVAGTGAIQGVIEDQLAAFQRDDLASAFQHASPMVQGKFGNPARFGRMVQQGYPMIWRPESYAMGPITDTPYGPIQIVTFLDSAGVSWEAEYRMRLVDGAWRIAGVSLKRLPGYST